MRNHLFLLGTAHTIQCGVGSASPELFKQEISTACAAYGLVLIAEEMSPDGLLHHRVTETLTKQVANARKIEYRMVDLSNSERNFLGIGAAAENSVFDSSDFNRLAKFRLAFDPVRDEARERIWAGRILSENLWPALLVCGANHVAGVQGIWNRLDMPMTVIHADYGA